jgi:hypothetical protein
MPGPGFGMPGEDHLQQTDPEMYSLNVKDHVLERKTMMLSEQYRRAPEGAKKDLEEKLKDIVGQHFDVRQQRRQLELKRMQKELKRLSEAIKRRQDNRDAIIQRRVMQLTDREDPLEF